MPGIVKGTQRSAQNSRQMPAQAEKCRAERSATYKLGLTLNIEYCARPITRMPVKLVGSHSIAKGTPIKLLGMTRDITERNLAELALHERNAQLAMAGEAALVGSNAYESDLEG